MSRHRRTSPRGKREELMVSNDFNVRRPRISAACAGRTSARLTEPMGIERHRWDRNAGAAEAGLSSRGGRMSGSERVNITEDVRKYASEQQLSEDDALRAGLDEKAKSFADGGAEIYAKA